MKIAVFHNLPAGGQKRALYEQVKRLSRNHTLDLYTLSITNESFLPLKPFVRKHFTVDYYPPPHFPQSVFSIYFNLPNAYKILANKINNKDYDVVYVNPCFLTQAPYILRYLQIPSLYSCPEPKREFYEYIPHVSNSLTYYLTFPFRLPIKNIDCVNARHATRVVTLSKYSQKRIDHIYGIRSYLNYLGVDKETFKPNVQKRENIALTIGELSLHKGHDFIIRCMALIPESIRPKLVIIGHGGIEKEYLVRLAKEHNIDLDLISNISDKELVNWYNKSKIFLYAGIREPFGLVILEALSCGTPVVAVNEGGIGEIITNNKLGVLVRRHEKEFADAIQQVLFKLSLRANRGISPDYIQKNWSWDKSVQDLEKHLKVISR